MPGYGAAGGGLNEQHLRGRAGAVGERATARIIARACPRATVIHNVWITPALQLDHLVIAGTAVWVPDSKKWRAGTYWSAGDKTWRGLFHAAHTHLGVTQRAVRELRSVGLHASGVLVVHGKVRILGRPGGITIVTADQFESWAATNLNLPANPAVVARISTLIR